MIDIHAHILSGFDDGAESPQVSTEIASRSQQDGVSHIIATPHVMDEDFSLLKERIQDGVAALRSVLEKESIDVEVLPGAEVHISATLVKHPGSLRDLTLGFGGRYVLLELPLQEIPRFTHELVFKLLIKGLVPILAHPERNMGIIERPERLLELVEKGSLVQVNAGSIMGKYGETVKRTVELLLRNRIVHFIASDAHSVRSRTPGLTPALARAQELFGENAEALVEANPRAVLEGKTLEFTPPKRLVRTRKKFLSWLPTRLSS